MLIPNIKPRDWGDTSKLRDDPMSPPMCRLVLPIITRKLMQVENSYVNRATWKTGTCKASRILAYLNPRGVARQRATPVNMPHANNATEMTEDITGRL